MPSSYRWKLDTGADRWSWTIAWSPRHAGWLLRSDHHVSNPMMPVTVHASAAADAEAFGKSLSDDGSWNQSPLAASAPVELSGWEEIPPADERNKPPLSP